MRPREAHVRPLPWSSLGEVHAKELRLDFEWTPEAEEAFLLLLAKGYSVGRITGQGEGWPSYADYCRKIGTDEVFHRAVENSKQKRAESLVDKAGETAGNARAATVQADRLICDNLWKTAAALDPERFGNKSQLGVSGGLILAAGSLAELAAQAALLHTKPGGSVTQGAQNALPSPDNAGAQDEA